MKNLFTFIFSVIIFCFVAQNANAQYHTILSENFDNNRFGWDEYRNRDARLNIRKGKYFFEHKRRLGAWTTMKPVVFDPRKNFRIETKIGKIYGVNNHGYGLIWGANDTKNHLVFLISGDGNFKIGVANNGRYKFIVPWKPSSFIKKYNKSNSLTIEKKDGRVSFFINGKFVAKIPDQPLFGNKIGFFIDKNISLKIDHLYASIEDVVIANNNTQNNNQTQAYPPDLFIEDLTFFEPSRNGALDGMERGEIRFKLKNKGRGNASNIEVKLVSLNNANGLEFSPTISIELLKSKDQKSVVIPISAKQSVQQLTRKFRIEVLESRGFDADPAVISFDTEETSRPELVIEQVAINDKEDANGRGDAYGNGNSIIEAGESIEVTAYVQNFGRGNALDVKALVMLGTEDVNITFPDVDKTFNLGDIESGDYRKIEFYFYTSRRYNQADIPFTVKLTDSRTNAAQNVDLQLKLGKRTANIVDVSVGRIENNDNGINVRDINGIVKTTDVDKNLPRTSHNGDNTLAIIIGIEQYRYAPKVDFAQHDVQVFYEYAKSVFNIPEKNIYYRTNDGATAGEFRKIFSDDGWLARRIVDGETEIIIYYAGHGAPDAKSKKAYLIPYDIDPNYATTGYCLDDIYSCVSKLNTKSTTIFLDACFSGVSRENEMLLAGSRSIIVKPKKSDKLGENTVVFAASEDDQYSSAYPDKYHGLFTYYLLKGLQGAARGRDYQLTVNELFDYVRKQVKSQAGYLDKEQEPTIEGKDKSRILLRY